MRDESPIAPLFFYVGIQLYDGNKFGGIHANVLDEHPLREMYRKDLTIPANPAQHPSTP